MLDRLGAPWKLLRAAEDFDDSIDRVILPGGESTTQGKLLRSTGLFEPIAAHIAAGKPVFGTCAGMILLARKLDNDSNVYFGALDAVVRRNAYGRQLGSFAATADFGSASGESAVVVGPGERVPRDSPSGVVLKDFPLVFIRGPFVAEVGPPPPSKRRWTATWSDSAKATSLPPRSIPNSPKTPASTSCSWACNPWSVVRCFPIPANTGESIGKTIPSNTPTCPQRFSGRAAGDRDAS